MTQTAISRATPLIGAISHTGCVIYNKNVQMIPFLNDRARSACSGQFMIKRMGINMRGKIMLHNLGGSDVLMRMNSFSGTKSLQGLSK